MIFRIEENVFSMFPHFCRGIVVADGLDNSRTCPEIEGFLREKEKMLQQDPQIDLTAHPRLLAWKEAYRRFGSNPNKFTPSIVFLTKQVKAGKAVRSISPIVNAFNAISMKYLVPSGGDDMDTVEGDMTLGCANAGEIFAPIFKPEEIEHPDAGEIIYVNRRTRKVMCRRWNWRNADFSKITPQTKKVAINVDGMLPAISRQEIEQAAEELGGMILRHCGGKITIYLLDAQKREIEHPV